MMEGYENRRGPLTTALQAAAGQAVRQNTPVEQRISDLRNALTKIADEFSKLRETTDKVSIEDPPAPNVPTSREVGEIESPIEAELRTCLNRANDIFDEIASVRRRIRL